MTHPTATRRCYARLSSNRHERRRHAPSRPETCAQHSQCVSASSYRADRRGYVEARRSTDGKCFRSRASPSVWAREVRRPHRSKRAKPPTRTRTQVQRKEVFLTSETRRLLCQGCYVADLHNTRRGKPIPDIWAAMLRMCLRTYTSAAAG